MRYVRTNIAPLRSLSTPFVPIKKPRHKAQALIFFYRKLSTGERDPSACPALSPAPWSPVGVLVRPLMLPSAVCDTSSSCKTTADIDRARHRLQVYHIDALTDPTEVVNLQALGDRPDLKGIRPPVCTESLPFVHESTVSVWVKSTGPFMAAREVIHIHMFSETYRRF